MDVVLIGSLNLFFVASFDTVIFVVVVIVIIVFNPVSDLHTYPIQIYGIRVRR